MKFGLGWRPELGAGILMHLDEIDIVEVLAEDFFRASKNEQRALRFLRERVSVVVHGTSLGLASPERVSVKRLDAMARLVGWLEPDFWSEHLAFVRAGSLEVGHLAAPPRNDATREGLQRNLEMATRIVGAAPLLENVASLVEPPCSTYTEAEWLASIPGTLLLDLHNLHANATNFGFDARAVIASTAPVGAIHIAGGRRIERDRILDDHLHDVPDPVFDLLREVAAPVVILERDGNYPAFDVLLEQLRRARRAAASPASPRCRLPKAPASRRSPGDATAFLAALYTDDALLQRFLCSPFETARAAGFTDDDARDLAAIDRENLKLAARSYLRKRTSKISRPSARYFAS